MSFASASATRGVEVEERRAEIRNACAGTGDSVEVLSCGACSVSLVDARAAASGVIYPLLVGSTGGSSKALAGADRKVVNGAIAALVAVVCCLRNVEHQCKRAIRIVRTAVDHLDS